MNQSNGCDDAIEEFGEEMKDKPVHIFLLFQ